MSFCPQATKSKYRNTRGPNQETPSPNVLSEKKYEIYQGMKSRKSIKPTRRIYVSFYSFTVVESEIIIMLFLCSMKYLTCFKLENLI